MSDDIAGEHEQVHEKPCFPSLIRFAGAIWIMVGGSLLVSGSFLLWHNVHSATATIRAETWIVTSLAIGIVMMLGLIGTGLSTWFGNDLPYFELGILSIISGLFGICSAVTVHSLITSTGVDVRPPWEVFVICIALIVAGLLAMKGSRTYMNLRRK